jgi:hypothetical protein
MDMPQGGEKKGVSEPEQRDPYQHKKQDLKKRPHLLRPVAGLYPAGYT